MGKNKLAAFFLFACFLLFFPPVFSVPPPSETDMKLYTLRKHREECELFDDSELYDSEWCVMEAKDCEWTGEKCILSAESQQLLESLEKEVAEQQQLESLISFLIFTVVFIVPLLLGVVLLIKGAKSEEVKKSSLYKSLGCFLLFFAILMLIIIILLMSGNY